MWCIGKLDSEYLAKMEGILDLYAKEVDPKKPRICFDERPCQLIDDILTPIPPKPGQTKRENAEYLRNGTCCVLLAYDMDSGKRFVVVSERRTKADYAKFMKKLLEQYPEAESIQLIQDNLNTHNYSSFIENFEKNEATAMRRKIEMIYTPKHASWLNMAEMEFSALSKQCLNRRIGTIELLEKEVKEWEKWRNKKGVKINWSFTVDKAHDKFSSQYANVLNNKN